MFSRIACLCGNIFIGLAILIICSDTVFASSAKMVNGSAHTLNVGLHWSGIVSLIIFVLAYSFVLGEEYSHLRKSKPVMLAAGLIWLIIGIVAPQFGADKEHIHYALFHNLDEYAGLMLFLLAAMTYISVLSDRNVFAVLRVRLLRSGLGLRQLFWVTGILAFFLSPLADNLTTVLVMGAVIVAVGGTNTKFVNMGCVNIVCAANAGGAFSPFGDITTLMVWQAGKVEFFEFFALFLPSLVCFLVPAALMTFFVPNEKPEQIREDVKMKRGAWVVIIEGLLTIVTAVTFEQFFGLPPFLGMMTGMSVLMITAWYLRNVGDNRDRTCDVFKNIAEAEWDTLLFFFGVIFSVGGLGYLGYLHFLSDLLYEGWGPTFANVTLGLLSALIDNIPVMFAVLKMEPNMDHFQWLLITLTTGVGGSLLSVGSAAGVGLMGVARGQYTFFSHLRWSLFIILGYAAAIGTHFIANGHMIGQ
ncbi:MAG: sodium:proton antiporter NhaD [Alphaproteobacteria bacterium]